MIEDNIRVLRQAARISAGEELTVEKTWCVVAGNVDLIDDMAYKAIASNHNVKILFREHVVLKDGKLDKKFDFIMLYGNTINLNDFVNYAQTKGGAVIKVARDYLTEEPNIMVFIAPEDVIKDGTDKIQKITDKFTKKGVTNYKFH